MLGDFPIADEMTTEMWFGRMMLRIKLTVSVSNDEVLRKTETKRGLILRIRRRELEYLGHSKDIVNTTGVEGKYE